MRAREQPTSGVVVLRVLSLALLFAALTSTAAAHDLALHGDPRAALPDSLVTHPVAAAEMAGLEPTTPAAGAGLPETWCGTPTDADGTVNQLFAPSVPQLKLIYAYASDQTNRFADLDDRLQANASLLSRYIQQQSGGRRTLRWDMGTDCGSQFVDIQVVQLPRPRSEYVVNGAPKFQLTAADVAAVVEPAQPGPKNWVIYADGFYGTNGVAGTAWRYEQDAANAPIHDVGRLESVVFGPQTLPAGAYAWPSVMLHEIAHNLGAVQNSAPHSTGAGHCNEGRDVMCYADGGPKQAQTNPCPSIAGTITDSFDCNGDDYFSAAPAFDSYLDTKWNVYRSAHLAPCTTGFAMACAGTLVDGTPPANTTPARSATAYTNTPYTVTLAGSDGESSVDAFAWRVDDGPVQTTQSATVANGEYLRTRVRDAAGNWSAWRADRVAVDTIAPDASLTCPARTVTERSATCTFTASEPGSFDAQLDGVATPTEAVTGGGRKVTITKAGSTDVAVRARDAAGNAGDWETAVVELAPAPPAVDVSCPDGWKVATVTCSVTTTAGAWPITSVAWRRGDAPAQAVSGSSFTVAADGQHAVSVTATDGGGRTATDSDTVWIDTSDPAVAVDCPAGWRPAATTCTVTASDATAGLADLSWSVDGGPAQSGASGAEIAVGHGSHAIAATARDAAGRTRTVSATAKVDLTPPLAAPSCPAGWQTAVVACTVTASDPESGVAEKSLRVDGGAATTVTDEGEHQVEARAVNGAGTASAWSAPSLVLVDLFAPAASLSCDVIQDGLYGCVAGGEDSGAGVAAANLVHDGGVRNAVALGERFTFAAQSPGLAVRVVDGAGRATTSATFPVRPPAAVEQRREEPPLDPLPPPVDPSPTTILPVIPPSLLHAAPSPLLDARGRRMGTFLAGPAAVVVAPGRLQAGTWRVRACAATRCVTRLIRLRRARTPAPLRLVLPASAGSRVTVALQRRVRGRYRPAGRGAATIA